VKKVGNRIVELKINATWDSTLGSLRQTLGFRHSEDLLRAGTSYFTRTPLAGSPCWPTKALNVTGIIWATMQFMERDHPKRFRAYSNKLQENTGIERSRQTRQPMEASLRFNEKGFKDPFYAQQESDGTMKSSHTSSCLKTQSPHFLH